MSDLELTAAAERLRRHCEAKTDGDDPYRGPTPHDPEMSYTFDYDRFSADILAVASGYLTVTSGGGANPCEGAGTSGSGSHTAGDSSSVVRGAAPPVSPLRLHGGGWTTSGNSEGI